MRKFILGTLLTLSFSAFAEHNKAQLTCHLKAGHAFQAANLELSFYKPMSEAECRAEGLKLFHTPAQVGWRKINPVNNTITETDIETQYRRVKITYHHADGESSRFTLKRKSVQKILKDKQTWKIQSGYRCWTQGDCE